MSWDELTEEDDGVLAGEGNGIIKTRHHLTPRASVLRVLRFHAFEQSCVQMFFGPTGCWALRMKATNTVVDKGLTA